MDSVASVSAADESTIAACQWESWFKAWLTTLELNLSPIESYSLSLRLTDDERIQHFNSTFRHVNRPTDVLAFASLEREGMPSQIWKSMPLELGDIVISVETALRQAPEHEHSLPQEMAWLASHGLLHLLGWDHPDAQQLKTMLHKQDQLLHQIGLINAYKCNSDRINIGGTD
ncbi:MAG: rRNA maturation RNase YbeY [Cyanobacteria bacterium P01_F01_bin.42]